MPLIVTPYISRVLGVKQIGIYSFTYSIVSYFMLASMLGINNYGIRNVAKASNKKEKLSEVFSSIYGLQLKLGVLALVIYLASCFFIFREYNTFFFINIFFLLSSILDINWFYFGIEKFKITISRNAIIKVSSMILIFLLVKTEGDLWIYTLIMALSTFFSQIYLFFILPKYIDFKYLSFNNSFKHLKKVLILFIPVLAYSIYRIMDKTMIGGLASVSELGFYESAEKVINIPIGILAALGTVMLPHMSKNTKEKNFKQQIINNFHMSFFFMVPMTIFLMIISNSFSSLYFGEAFSKSGVIITLLSITIIFGTITNIIRTNYLIPQNEDDTYVKSTIFGAIVNLILNLIFIKALGAFGACIGTIAAEFSVMLYQIIKTRNIINYKLVSKILIIILFKSLLAGTPVLLIELWSDSSLLKLIYQGAIFSIVFAFLNRKYLMNDFFNKKSL